MSKETAVAKNDNNNLKRWLDNTFSHTDEHIRKLASNGVGCASIARKLGRPGDLARVHKVVRGCECVRVEGAERQGGRFGGG